MGNYCYLIAANSMTTITSVEVEKMKHHQIELEMCQQCRNICGSKTMTALRMREKCNYEIEIKVEIEIFSTIIICLFVRFV